MKFGNPVADIFIIKHRNLVRMRSDLTFLWYIVYGYSFSWIQCSYYKITLALINSMYKQDAKLSNYERFDILL